MNSCHSVSTNRIHTRYGDPSQLGVVCVILAIGAAMCGCKPETHPKQSAKSDGSIVEKAAPTMTEKDIENELFDLQAAVDQYKARMGAFPVKPSEIEPGVRKMYPQWKECQADCKAANLDFSKIDGRKALVFWLGGMRESPGSHNLIGFSMNPNHPLELGNRGLHSVSFTFKPDRLVECDGWLEYTAILPDGKRATYEFDGKDVTLPGFSRGTEKTP
jgi:hypothetical protein